MRGHPLVYRGNPLRLKRPGTPGFASFCFPSGCAWAPFKDPPFSGLGLLQVRIRHPGGSRCKSGRKSGIRARRETVPRPPQLHRTAANPGKSGHLSRRCNARAREARNFAVAAPAGS